MKIKFFLGLSASFSLVFILVSNDLYSQKQQISKAPVTEEYAVKNKVRSGIAHGGIGTGSVELRKDGQFYNWSIFNNQPLSTGPIFQLRTNPLDSWNESLQFFIVRYQEEGKEPKLKLLQMNQSLSEGAMESIDYNYPWMSAFEKIEYSARFPFTWMTFTDSEMPLKIELEAFSPFIPNDVKNSSLPGVYFNFKITSLSEKNIKVMLVASQRNLVGYDVTKKYFIGNLEEKPGYKFFEQSVGGMDTAASSFGQMGMASVFDSGKQAAQIISFYYDLVPESEKKAALDQLMLEIFNSHKGHLSTGIFATKFMFDFFRTINRNDVSYTIANQRSYPGWGNMLQKGATTLHESWAYQDTVGSQNHPMFGSISEWFYRSLLGINSTAPGFTKFEIKPQPTGDLTWAKGHYDALTGIIESDWKIKGRNFYLNVSILANTQALVYIPSKNSGKILESGKDALSIKGLIFKEYKDGYALFSVVAGKYSFVSELNENNKFCSNSNLF